MPEKSATENLILGYVEYSTDGSITIRGNTDGYPQCTGVVPTPDVNTESPVARLERYVAACNKLTLRGYHITSKRLIRNSAFDRPGQKTTLQLKYRPSRNEKEAKKLEEQIVQIIYTSLGGPGRRDKMMALLNFASSNDFDHAMNDFISRNEKKIAHIIEERRDELIKIQYASYGELYLIFYLIENDIDQLKSLWEKEYYLDDLRKLSLWWGNSIDDLDETL